MSNHYETPDITLTTTTSLPQTTTTTTSYTIGGNRRPRSNAPSSINLSIPATPNNESEPFPALSPAQTPHTATYTPGLTQSPTQDYFATPPTRYQVNPRSIGLRRLPSSENTTGRHRSGSGSLRRRGNSGHASGHTDPGALHSTQSHPENATAGLAGLPGHYEVGPAGMGTIREDEEAHHGQGHPSVEEETENRVGRSGSTRLRRASNAARSILSKFSDDQDEQHRGRAFTGNGTEYESDVVDYLDVLDPEVSTLTTLTNVQNALFVPDIPFLNRYYNRRPTYELTRGPSRVTEASEPITPTLTRQVSRLPVNKPVPPTPEPPEVPEKTRKQRERVEYRGDSSTPEPLLTSDLDRRASITSHVEEDHYAVLPHGVTLDGWSQDDVDMLDDYVRHMLHSRRSKFKQSMKGFGKYLRKPLGFFVTLYAFLITVFGFVWVLFLIGWISLGARKNYIIHIVDSVLVALFGVMGYGLAPFRAIDTYHMIYIAHYHRLSWKIRKEKNLPKLSDHNDLPERTQDEVCADAEAGHEKDTDADWEYSVLSPEQQRKLVHHQNKFSKSHSYYRPHETTTHFAFPLKLLITIVSLCDAHSVLQIMLGSFTWGWSYHTRPEWITAVILSVSITCNISAGVLISVGDKRTRKKDVLLRMARQGLTEEAMRQVAKDKRKRDEEVGHLKPSIAQAHAINVAQGVSEPKGEEFVKGTEQIKKKLEGYKTDRESDSESTKSKSRSRSHEGTRAVDRQDQLEKTKSSQTDSSFRTASNRLNG